MWNDYAGRKFDTFRGVKEEISFSSFSREFATHGGEKPGRGNTRYLIDGPGFPRTTQMTRIIYLNAASLFENRRPVALGCPGKHPGKTTWCAAIYWYSIGTNRVLCAGENVINAPRRLVVILGEHSLNLLSTRSQVKLDLNCDVKWHVDFRHAEKPTRANINKVCDRRVLFEATLSKSQWKLAKSARDSLHHNNNNCLRSERETKETK